MIDKKRSVKQVRGNGRSPLMIILFVLLIVYAVTILLPIVWGLFEALMDGDKIESTIIPWPSDWKFDNFFKAFGFFYVPVESEIGTVYPDLWFMFGYTMLYAVGSAFMATFVPCIVAYLTARFDYFFSRLINVFVVVAIALPIVGSLPSEIQMAKTLGLYDKFWGIWIMKSHFISVYYLIFYARFKSFPTSYEEAAQIDGAGHLRIFFRVILPLVKNLFWTVFLIMFIAFWNDYYTPLVYMPTYPTVAYGMWYFNNSTENVISNVPMKITGCVLMLIPILVLFAIFGKRLMGNLTEGGDKE
ncbi:MAG: carbohydrate ABC transporter permease [Clostridia bacterium]|nr:carbohydrate ABC transporter permease [Clostridia bacterium]